jgi:hypothetical protein
VKEEDMFCDEGKMLKGSVDILSIPPSRMEGGYVELVCPKYEQMVLI